jgi:hypothetical protein
VIVTGQSGVRDGSAVRIVGTAAQADGR